MVWDVAEILLGEDRVELLIQHCGFLSRFCNSVGVERVLIPMAVCLIDLIYLQKGFGLLEVRFSTMLWM